MIRPHSDSTAPDIRVSDAALGAKRSSAEQAALAEAWRAVDNAVRSIFELARSLELLSDAIRRVETDPIIEFREIDNAHNRFRIE